MVGINTVNLPNLNFLFIKVERMIGFHRPPIIFNVCVTIFGAGPGISQSVAKTFGKQEFSVALVSRNSNRLQNFVDELTKESIVAKSFSGDVANAESLKNTISTIKENFESIDVVHYNAAAVKMLNVLNETADSLTEDFNVNVVGLHTVVLQTMNELETSKGAILVAGGGLATNPYSEMASLFIGKAGVKNLAGSISQALSSKDIFVGMVTVNGMVSTESEVYSPDNIANQFWKLYSNRNEFEIQL
ncbi:MAG: SDR family NAD(P)-dependent oxidoreductase [Flavobacterium sp.]|uniref:SDR family NAD(P)-dependent oxidoreductase n=1 Tax=Flavobacterium sp. TaxID=239 RepID=UPI0032661BFB